jgi:hypothetical protein
MSYSVQPSVLNLKREEHSAWPKRTPNFRKGSILLLAASQVMEHENRNRRRKTPVRERQRCRIALNHGCIRAVHPRTELGGKRVIILKTRHASSEAP